MTEAEPGAAGPDTGCAWTLAPGTGGGSAMWGATGSEGLLSMETGSPHSGAAMERTG